MARCAARGRRRTAPPRPRPRPRRRRQVARAHHYGMMPRAAPPGATLPKHRRRNRQFSALLIASHSLCHKYTYTQTHRRIPTYTQDRFPTCTSPHTPSLPGLCSKRPSSQDGQFTWYLPTYVQASDEGRGADIGLRQQRATAALAAISCTAAAAARGTRACQEPPLLDLCPGLPIMDHDSWIMAGGQAPPPSHPRSRSAPIRRAASTQRVSHVIYGRQTSYNGPQPIVARGCYFYWCSGPPPAPQHSERCCALTAAAPES